MEAFAFAFFWDESVCFPTILLFSHLAFRAEANHSPQTKSLPRAAAAAAEKDQGRKRRKGEARRQSETP